MRRSPYCCKSPLATKSTVGFNLTNLASVLTERGEFEEALVAAREGLALLRDGDYSWNLMEHVASRAALVGKLANAARPGPCSAVAARRAMSRSATIATELSPFAPPADLAHRRRLAKRHWPAVCNAKARRPVRF